ncbi:hypothetical protein C8Q80DRAFT_1119551 [Daedaleopsis nitida]|nr:hypothetical protein C8Q80DRAFT_1119551 [Daedaleopsis nitida]
MRLTATTTAHAASPAPLTATACTTRNPASAAPCGRAIPTPTAPTKTLATLGQWRVRNGEPDPEQRTCGSDECTPYLHRWERGTEGDVCVGRASAKKEETERELSEPTRDERERDTEDESEDERGRVSDDAEHAALGKGGVRRSALTFRDQSPGRCKVGGDERVSVRDRVGSSKALCQPSTCPYPLSQGRESMAPGMIVDKVYARELALGGRGKRCCLSNGE